jgi:hypothetical protein
MRLLIAIPSLDLIQAKFTADLLRLVNKLYKDGIDFEVEIRSGSMVHAAREYLAWQAIEREFTHVLWLDSDMTFEPDLVDGLMASGESFVTAVCAARREPYPLCIFSSLLNHEQSKWEGPYPDEPFEVAGCGMACVLMETKILQAVYAAYRTCFTPMNSYGEDTAFCLRASGLGFKMYAEPRVKVGHIGQTIIYPKKE